MISQILYSLEAFRICANLCNLWELFVVCNLWEFFCRMQSVEAFCRVQSVGETLYLEYPFILRCISLFILSVLKLTSIPKCKLHKRR